MFTGSRNVASKKGENGTVALLAFCFNRLHHDIVDDVSKLIALGFKAEDCIAALENCEGKLDDAALWLTQNAVPSRGLAQEGSKDNNDVFIKAVEVRAFNSSCS